MKKIVLVALILAFASASFAADSTFSGLSSGAHQTLGMALSKNVEGAYYVDTAQANFAITTGHNKGNTVYATANFTTSIYKSTVIAGATVAAEDLLAAPSTFTEAQVFPADGDFTSI